MLSYDELKRELQQAADIANPRLPVLVLCSQHGEQVAQQIDSVRFVAELNAIVIITDQDPKTNR